MSGPPPFPADFKFKEQGVCCQQGSIAATIFLDANEFLSSDFGMKFIQIASR